MGDKTTDSGMLDSISQRDILIAVVGNAGVGKSTFIHKAAAKDPLSLDQAPRTENMVRYVVCPKPDLYQDRKVVLLDIPAFDSGFDEQVIENWLRHQLRVVSRKRFGVFGILYLHCTTEVEFSGVSLRHLKSLANLFEESGQSPVGALLVLTMQAHPCLSTHLQRKKEIQEKWNTLCPWGAPQSTRFENSQRSAWEIVIDLTTYMNTLAKQSGSLHSIAPGAYPPTGAHTQPTNNGPEVSPKRQLACLTEPLPAPPIPVRAMDAFKPAFIPTRHKATLEAADGTAVTIKNLGRSSLPPANNAPINGRISTLSQAGMTNNRLYTPRGKQSSGNTNVQKAAADPEPVAPLKDTESHRDRTTIQVDADSVELVDRNVKGLLNKLATRRFDSISDQIIEWANKSEKENDGRTLIRVIHLVFEKATDEAAWSEMYARLCRKMMEQISSKVQDDGTKTPEGKPVGGGQLFRKYLLNKCQEDFERGWGAKKVAAAVTDAASEENKEGGDKEVALYSEEYYAAQKAKRQGLGLIKFIGELFKLQMLTERIMHMCVKKLLSNVNNPEEEEVESLCQLLTTVGSRLDTQKAHAHMDAYFRAMAELAKSPNLRPRLQLMLQDVIELRERKWVARNAIAPPSMITQSHKRAAKGKAAQEKEYFQRSINTSTARW
ncbi:ARM repeat-containing protein [Macrolepiota fuliginosa MF-IS2]|uniref:ARM repeat-containing protein n=1 Tax=Macrolepiota fuliginosa MF-IS2 TaxID=1400762 RepID=A0A9P6BV18_9AGAR|nr:ARM repeat-containing protein [Macrolepiota fuliginosa MF-IS2]